MLDVRKSFVVVGCVAVGFIVSAGPGLVARAAEPDRWVGAIAADAAKSTAMTDDAAQRRIVELERKVKELEAERSTAAGSSRELASARARTEALEAHNRALALENQELAHKAAAEAQVASTCGLEEGTDPKEQLRYWAQRMRNDDRGFRGRMSSEWNAALNVVLRRDRPLDPRNPWREP